MRFVEYHHREGCRNVRVIDATRIALKNHVISDDTYRHSIMASLRSVGWSGDRPVSKGSKLKISGELLDVGLVLWFGNMHSIHEYIMALELLYHKNKINSAVVITATRDEAVRRFHRNKSEKGTSTGNYSEFDTLVSHLKCLEDIVNIPLTVIGVGE